MMKILDKSIVVIGAILIIYCILGSIWFRWSNPDNTETEVFLEVITLGWYK